MPITVDLVNMMVLSTLAGLATGIGGFAAVIKRPGERLFGFLTGFAAGVMIVLSFVGLVAEAWKDVGFLMTTAGFTIGAILMFSFDFLIPHIHFWVKEGVPDGGLLKTGRLIAIGITLHNLPEGISVCAACAHSPGLGALVGLAVGLHNIPEGIATALPLYMSGSSRLTAFRVALLSGLAEPLGAILAALFLGDVGPFIPVALAFAAGVMIFITLDELVPIGHKHGHEHFTGLGIIAGMILLFLLSGMFNI